MPVCQNGPMSSPQTPDLPSGGTVLTEQPVEDALAAPVWMTIVWDDPVNLMTYVTHVFRTYFNYPKKKAERLMMQVHVEGRAAVSSGDIEQMERDVNAMHSYGLWATLERQE